ncbi:MAG TPA: alpha/beta hydrolase [Terriglobia bacterium]|nr:alpha/beta hydrolase [Terriglobia bacterium]
MADEKKRWRVWLKRLAGVMGISVVFLVFVALPVFVSGQITRVSTRPADARMSSTPKDYSAPYRNVEFRAADGVPLSGWRLDSREKQVTIVFAHGLARSRRELLERAIDLWRLGYGVLLYDARNHGESGPARVTLGYDERLDVEGAVRFLRSDTQNTNHVALYGVSMGAVASLLAAAETPEAEAVIADSAYLNLTDTINHHVHLITRLPAFPLGAEFRILLEYRCGFDARKVDSLEAARRIGARPAMFIAGANDPRMPPQIAEKLYEASTSPDRRLLINDGPGAEIHGHAYAADPQRYIREVDEFLTTAFP